jgi:hypothetical protein
VHETAGELDALDAILERSFDVAGPHLTVIISEPRCLGSRDLACAPRRHQALRGRHDDRSERAQVLRRRHPVPPRPRVALDGVFVHGTVRVVRGATEEAAALAPFWRDVHDETPEDWADAPHDARYVDFLPSSMYTYAFNRERFEALVERGQEPGS